MNFIVYILVYPIIWLISILPFRVLYMLSDLIYLLIYYVIGYRKEVVFSNLKLAFPEKSDDELRVIRKKFYSHFVDIFMEMIKSFTISKNQLQKHCKYTNLEVLNDLQKDGKSIILIGSHYANWEWLFGLSTFINYKSYVAFTKVSNKYFNNKILKSRGRFGWSLEQNSRIISKIESNLKDNVQAMYGLLSDQSPQITKAHYWSSFLGVKVPIHTGAEMLAKKYNLSLVIIETKKIKRGYYESSFKVITKEPTSFPDFELTDIFLRRVEKQIREQPQYYFWTHKRFKHKDKEPK